MTAPVTCILGVDPGVTGGLAWYFPASPNHVTAEDIPVAGGEVDVDTLAARIRQMRPTVTFIERASSRPGQGVSSTFKYGTAYGALRACCAVMEVPTHLVTPGKWKGHFRLSSDKEMSRALAIRLWPGVGCFSRKMDHGRAEAALIAKFGAEQILRVAEAA